MGSGSNSRCSGRGPAKPSSTASSCSRVPRSPRLAGRSKYERCRKLTRRMPPVLGGAGRCHASDVVCKNSLPLPQLAVHGRCALRMDRIRAPHAAGRVPSRSDTGSSDTATDATPMGSAYFGSVRTDSMERARRTGRSLVRVEFGDWPWKPRHHTTSAAVEGANRHSLGGR